VPVAERMDSAPLLKDSRLDGGESGKPDARIFERGPGTFVYNALFREEPL